MRAYLVVTSIIFALLVVAHIWRGFSERGLLAQPWFYVVTILPGMLAVWAIILLRRSPRI